MKQILIKYSIFFIVYLVLDSCSSKTSSSDTSKNEQEVIVEKIKIDTTSADSFIESIRNLLLSSSEMKNYSGHEINGKLILDNKAGFKIFNFTELFDEYKYNTAFSIVLMPLEAGNFVQSDKDVFILIEKVLRNEGLTYSLYEGNFAPSLDFQQDGSNDFLLEDQHLFRDNYTSRKQVILYDGKNALSPTQIIAVSDYVETEEGLSGVKAEIIVNPEKTPKIVVEKQETVAIENSTGGNIQVPLAYNLSWQWHKAINTNESYWKTGLIVSYEKSSEYLELITAKRTQLTESDTEEYGYVVLENCQNGGANLLSFEKVQQENDLFYKLQSNDDDVGTDIALSTVKIGNENWAVMLGRIEELELNKTGYPKISGAEERKIFIRKNISTHGQQLELIRFGNDSPEFVYTLFPESYTFKKCN